MTPQLKPDLSAQTVARSLKKASDHLLGLQRPEGYWWGELRGGDATLEADYILLELFLHPPRNGVWDPPNKERIRKAVDFILSQQLPDGGFSIYPKGPADVSASVKAYFALKVAGVLPDSPEMRLARERILSLGGIQSVNSYVKINLSLFGLYPRQYCPSVPPEMILLPGHFIYQMSSWTRAIVIPLSIVQALSGTRPVPAGFTLDELFLPGGRMWYRGGDSILSWRSFFLGVDRLLKFWEKHGSQALRWKAIREAERWILERTRYSDGLAAIYPPMMYVLMALDVLGYERSHPEFVEAERQFFRLLTDDGQRFFFQPCFSPVWDTAIATFALARTGMAPPEALSRAVAWLLTKEVRHKGDWSVKRPHMEPSGWYFEFANEFYPDIDDTAMVLLALRSVQARDAQRQNAAVQRALRWLLAMQSRDGGWAAFDVDNDWQPLSEIPFADHNAMLDSTCPDITGRVLEALASWGYRPEHPAIRRGVQYLLDRQEPGGCWYGRWGVNYIYGTFLALRGLRAAGQDPCEAHILRAAEWLRSVQNPDGGWGESCASYDHGHFTPAESTASQTAWAILGLLAAGDTGSRSLMQGIEYLVATQREDGSWHEELATGTGFPRVYYLVYQLYRQSFPILALAEFQKARQSGA